MAGQGRPGRRRLRRRRRRRSSRPTARSATSSSPTPRPAASRRSSIDTGASAPVEATAENASKAIADAKVVGTGKDLALDLDYTTKAEGAYPIVLVTYEIACDKGNKAETLPATKSFLTYIASEDGQSAPRRRRLRRRCPTEIAAKVRATIAALSY